MLADLVVVDARPRAGVVPRSGASQCRRCRVSQAATNPVRPRATSAMVGMPGGVNNAEGPSVASTATTATVPIRKSGTLHMSNTNQLKRRELTRPSWPDYLRMNTRACDL